MKTIGKRKKSALIFGAGAIGRGFLPQVLLPHGYEISFVEKNRRIVKLLNERKKYKVAIAHPDRYEFIDIPVKECFEYGEKVDISKYDIVFSSVGPSNCYELADKLKNAKAVISCENDDTSARKLRELSGNPRIYFGIPDVITSNTAPAELLEEDSLTTVTENGILVVEKGNYNLPKEIGQLGKIGLATHWRCKMYIHNMPHAIVAYLGAIRGYKFIHEAMTDPEIDRVVSGAVEEVVRALILSKMVDKSFAESYRDKELRRFRNKRLFDPISRVAREPIRKLAKDNRLVLALRLCIAHNIKPKNIAVGIKAALLYDHIEDSESQYIQNLRKSMTDSEVLKEITGIEVSDPLNEFILTRPIDKISRGLSFGSQKYLESAVKAAKTSGNIIKDYHKKVDDFKQKNTNIRDIVTEVDILSEKNIRQFLKKIYPSHICVGEELGRDKGNSDYVWYIDPLDGTVNYSRGIPLCAISLALAVKGEIEVGVIYNPFLDELYTAIKNKGAFLNGDRIEVSKRRDIIDCLFVGAFSSARSQKKKKEYELFGKINDSSRGGLRLGSAAMTMAYLASGRIDGFWAEDLFSWDLAAGNILIKEAGGKVTNFDGKDASLKSNQICASNGLIHNNFLRFFKK